MALGEEEAGFPECRGSSTRRRVSSPRAREVKGPCLVLVIE